MKHHIWAVSVCLLLAQSCTNKNEFHAQPAVSAAPVQRLAGEDEDKRIRTKIVDFDQQVMSGVRVELRCATDTIINYTDDLGETTCFTRFAGEWHAHITKPGYIPVDTSFLVTDSITNLQIALAHK